jgi:hypothetical protein
VHGIESPVNHHYQNTDIKDQDKRENPGSDKNPIGEPVSKLGQF